MSAATYERLRLDGAAPEDDGCAYAELSVILMHREQVRAALH
jgi:hypothetical protein